MNDIFLSIIIPTYNSALTIRESIDSIIFQTYTNYEILILDGLSTDNTVEVVNSYQDSRIKIFSEKDNGIYDAMNKGIKLANGQWVFFLGSDDLLFDYNVLSNIYEFSINHKTLDVIYGNAFFKNAKIEYYGSTNLERLLLENNLCHQSVFYHSSIFSKIGDYNLKYPLYADWDFNIRCFMHPSFYIKYIDLIVSLYNDLDGTSAKLIDTDLNFLNILPRHHVSIQKETCSKSVEFKIGWKIMAPIRYYNKISKRIFE